MIEIISTGTFDMTRFFQGFDITSEGLQTSSSSELSWNMIDGNGLLPSISIQIIGSGFSVGSGGISAGHVTEMRIVLDRFAIGTLPEATITGLDVNLTDLVDDVLTGSLNLKEVLEDQLPTWDRLTLGDGSFGFGDALDVSGGTHKFGWDRLELTGEDGTLWGDARTLVETDAIGGGDRLFASGTLLDAVRLIGEAQSMTNATLTGGNDRLVITATLDPDAGSSRSLLVGDVQDVIGASHLIGGDDSLSGGRDMSDRIFGDAEVVTQGASVVVGGDDKIFAFSGDDFLYGDVDILASGTLTGGDDTIFAGPGDDIAFGDYGRLQGGTMLAGGDDELFGRSGNDSLLGQGGDDLIKGGQGADVMTGDGGRDVIFGWTGNDIIVGGTGGDTMDGGPGADTFLWQGVEDLGSWSNRDQVAGFESGLDTLDLGAVGRLVGGLTWVGENYVDEFGTIGFVTIDNRKQLRGNLDQDPTPELVIFFRGGDAVQEADLILA